MESINPDCFIKIQLIDFEYCHILVIYFLAFNLDFQRETNIIKLLIKSKKMFNYQILFDHMVSDF